LKGRKGERGKGREGERVKGGEGEWLMVNGETH